MVNKASAVNQEGLLASLKRIEKLVAGCITALGNGKLDSPKPRKAAQADAHPRDASLRDADFSLPFRAFISKYARKLGGGPAKFALVLAHLTKGKLNSEVELATIEKAWKRKKGVLGVWNLAYPTRAKDKGWVDSPKKGVYVLLSGWAEIMRG